MVMKLTKGQKRSQAGTRCRLDKTNALVNPLESRCFRLMSRVRLFSVHAPPAAPRASPGPSLELGLYEGLATAKELVSPNIHSPRHTRHQPRAPQIPP